MLKKRLKRKTKLRTTRRRWDQCEQLESRICLSVSASVDHGSLLVEGDAEGEVVITAGADGAFVVTHGDDEPIMVEGVTNGIRINLEDETAGADDTVTVDLAGQTVDYVVARLGDGNNTFVLKGGTVDGSASYQGGDGTDLVEIATDAVIEGGFFAQLGSGDNNLTVSGQIGGNLRVASSNILESVQVGEDAVGGNMTLTDADVDGLRGRGRGSRGFGRFVGPQRGPGEVDNAANREERIERLREAIANDTLPEGIDAERAAEILEALENGERPDRGTRGRRMFGGFGAGRPNTFDRSAGRGRSFGGFGGGQATSRGAFRAGMTSGFGGLGGFGGFGGFGGNRRR